jgi:homoserine dehydrogenase
LILIGFGTVGQSLAKILHSDLDRIVKTYGFSPLVTCISDSQGSCINEEGLDLELALKTKEKYGTVAKYPRLGQRGTSPLELVSESDVEAVVETTPSNFKDGEPGLSNIKTSLATGKHVVTANKGPLALAMAALLELADHRGVRLRFSGTVGGGTPFLDFAAKCLPGERIVGVRGILNGTTNYILSRMEDASIGFREALVEAQARGIAEADPRNDVEGLDTAAKLVIIANWVLKRRVNIRDLEIRGVSGVTLGELNKARSSKNRVKLVGRLEESLATVGPEEVAMSDPICVQGTINALTFSTEHAGDVTLIGAGAGGERTASALVRDLVEIRREYIV